jgi:uncharacterized protein
MRALFRHDGQSRIMSMSLRDQLLKAGLINKKQADEAERQQQRQERRPPPKNKHAAAAASKQTVAPQVAHTAHTAQVAQVAQTAQTAQAAQVAKAARDQALNRRQHEKAEKKARLAQIKQWIDQNRLPTVENGEPYNFVDGAKIRRIAIDASIRARLSRGDIAIVRHEGRYDLVPALIAARIRERDEQVFIAYGVSKEEPPADDAYEGFSVPDDLIW